jgi:manganese/zinc/iron transport system permease protein
MLEAFFTSIPAMILTTGLLVGLSGALLGCFLILRGAAMLTDAISHAIVLGIITVWMLTGHLHGPVQLAGAVVTGLITVALTQLVHRTRLVQMDAAIGLVFPAMFALGVLLINLNARNLHLDVDAVLLGEIAFVWIDTIPVLGQSVPVATLALAVVFAINLTFVGLFWKELKLASFDPALATALGFAPGLIFYALLALTSVTAVASFEAVGAILFIAFVITPPATAFLLTRRLAPMVLIAAALSALSCVTGYALAQHWDVNIGAMMAAMTGVFFTLALVLSPQDGFITRRLRAGQNQRRIDSLTLILHLAAHEGSAHAATENSRAALVSHLGWPEKRARAALRRALDDGLIRRSLDAGADQPSLHLTEAGRARAQSQMRFFSADAK